jgi:transcriptional regulator with XRE-family HTH domain
VVALFEAGMGFKENLKRLRAERGWSQDQTAKRADVPTRTYQNWEVGPREPRLAAVVRLARVFGVTTDELLAGVGEEEPAPEPPAPRKGRKK